ncbi:hypothetical protein HPG69_001265, partial [Diceros bicornis minor]
IQEFHEKQEQFVSIKEVSETQEKTSELEQLKEQLKAKDSSLQKSERLVLTERHQESQEEIKIIIKERDELKGSQEALQMERGQLKENIKEIVGEDLDKQEELKTTYILPKEYQETISTRNISEKTDQGAGIQRDLENSEAELQEKDLDKQEELRIAHMHLKEHEETIDKLREIQELQEKEHQLLKAKNDLRENTHQTEQFRKQLEAQNSTLESIEAEKFRLTQKHLENLEEIKLVTKERDGLRRVEETLKMERDQLRERLREMEAKTLS